MVGVFVVKIKGWICYFILKIRKDICQSYTVIWTVGFSASLRYSLGYQSGGRL